MRLAVLRCLGNLAAGTQFHTVWCNLLRISQAVKMIPAMAAGVSRTLWTMNDIVALIDATAPAPEPRGLSRKRAVV